MSTKFDDSARRAIALAEEEARAFNHEYVGTEHLLLGLLREGPTGAAVDALHSFGVDAGKVRAEIEALVHRGPAAVSQAGLPLTPRAARVVECAAQEARVMSQKCVGPEHLLLGLFREPDGVAAKVLQNLGLKLDRVRDEALKIRLLQMKAVERAVRPVRAGAVRKRKMREELLAHFESIYEEERARPSDPQAALEEATRRFGDPAELARELERAVPLSDRFDYRVERMFGWRAPESAARFAFRLAMQVFAIIASVFALTLGSAVTRTGWDYSSWIAARPLVAFVLLVPVNVFVLSLLYFKMRDSLWGAFGARRSRLQALAYGVLIVLVFLASWLAFFATSPRLGQLMHLLWVGTVFGLGMAITSFILARTVGRAEIADAQWACLDLNRPPGEGPAEPPPQSQIA